MLIDEQNKPQGVVPTRDALRMAQERSLDLVEVGPQAKPPVCKLMDFGAYQYRQERAARKQKAKVKQIEVKGIRLSLKMGAHDREVRAKQAGKFLSEGDKVKIEMIFRGRENAHRDLGAKIIQDFVTELGAVVEQPIARQGNKFFCLVGAGAGNRESGVVKHSPSPTPDTQHPTPSTT